MEEVTPGELPGELPAARAAVREAGQFQRREAAETQVGAKPRGPVAGQVVVAGGVARERAVQPGPRPLPADGLAPGHEAG